MLKCPVTDFDDLGSTPSTPHYAIDGKAPITNDSMDLQRQIHELTLEVNQFLLKLPDGLMASQIVLVLAAAQRHAAEKRNARHRENERSY